MSEERRMILEMLKDGTIGVDEAERLLSAIPDDAAGGAAEKRISVGGGIHPKRLRLNAYEGDKTKVNMTVPFALVRAGLKIAQVVGPKYSEEAKALEHIDIDEILDNLSAGEITLPYTILCADDEAKNEHVEIILE